MHFGPLGAPVYIVSTEIDVRRETEIEELEEEIQRLEKKAGAK